jgi:hypothetical protein
MKALIGKDGLDRRPHNVATDVWYYEMRGGLEIHWNPPKDGSYLVCIIPWKSVRASLRRKEAPHD